ncbi:MAG: hypothetical protein LBL90_00730 [Prevotellaceae bacterium]|jgi:uncharacterized phage-associated protein|nr:hypothetical protein [Prevotellaceae bacterium]
MTSYITFIFGKDTKIIQRYFFGKWTASALSEWSHKEGSPWEKTVSTEEFKWGDKIEDGYIKSYFTKIIQTQ